MLSLPDPLHPAVVHLPIALAMLMPLVALAAAIAIRSAALAPRLWLAVILLQAVLVGSGWLALETGEDQEDRVEEIVAERHIHAHEERAETFQLAAVVALAVTAAGLLPGTAGAVGRGAAVLATLVVLGTGIQVGHSGGELVYRYGAASAYAGQAAAGETQPAALHDDDD